MSLEEAKAWWAFQPLPELHGPASGSTVDQFIDAKLHDAGVTANPAADRRTLIRRATYDLTGLPPTPEEVERFRRGRRRRMLSSGSSSGCSSSPQYGEQLGPPLARRRALRRHGGREHRPPAAARLALSQLGHRRLQPRPALRRVRAPAARRRHPARRARTRRQRREGIIATGYLAIARRFGHDIDKDIHLTHEDVIDNLGKNVPRPDRRLRPLPRSQVRPDHRAGLLRPLRHPRQHAVRLSRLRAEGPAARPGAAADRAEYAELACAVEGRARQSAKQRGSAVPTADEGTHQARLTEGSLHVLAEQPGCRGAIGRLSLVPSSATLRDPASARARSCSSPSRRMRTTAPTARWSNGRSTTKSATAARRTLERRGACRRT